MQRQCFRPRLILRASNRCFSRNSSTNASGAAPKPPNFFSTAKSFFYNNRQQLMNIIGVYFVFSYAIHNYRVKTAWDSREVEFKELKKEVDHIKSSMVDETWLASVCQKLKSSKGDNVILLKDQISARLLQPEEIPIQESSGSDKGDSSNSDLNALGALVSGTGGGRML